jgi:hypothetical protein
VNKSPEEERRSDWDLAFDVLYESIGRIPTYKAITDYIKAIKKSESEARRRKES